MKNLNLKPLFKKVLPLALVVSTLSPLSCLAKGHFDKQQKNLNRPIIVIQKQKGIQKNKKDIQQKNDKSVSKSTADSTIKTDAVQELKSEPVTKVQVDTKTTQIDDKKIEAEADEYIENITKEIFEVAETTNEKNEINSEENIYNKIVSDIDNAVKNAEQTSTDPEKLAVFTESMNIIKKEAEKLLNDSSNDVSFSKIIKLTELWFKGRITADTYFSNIKTELVDKVATKSKNLFEELKEGIKADTASIKEDLKDFQQHVNTKFQNFMKDHFKFKVPEKITINLNAFKVM